MLLKEEIKWVLTTVLLCYFSRIVSRNHIQKFYKDYILQRCRYHSALLVTRRKVCESAHCNEYKIVWKSSLNARSTFLQNHMMTDDWPLSSRLSQSCYCFLLIPNMFCSWMGKTATAAYSLLNVAFGKEALR